MRLLWLGACLGALALATPDAAAQQPAIETCQASGEAHWPRAVEHYRASRAPDAIAELDAILAACDSNDPISAQPRLMRADLALGAGDAQRALDLLETGAPQPNSGFVRWMRLNAHAKLGHTEQMNALSLALITDSGAALERLGMRHVETFEANGYSIAGYQGTLNQGAFTRYAYFLIRPLAGGLPQSIAISKDNLLLPGPTAYSVDLYFCAGHATLDQFTERRPPDYQRARQALDSWLGHSGEAQSAITFGDGGCAFPQYLTPGLD